MKLKTLIVDDEYPARQELRFMLEDYSDKIQIVGEAANAQEAWELIQALEYSMLFLDIDMPGLNGLELPPGCRNTHGEKTIMLLLSCSLPHTKNLLLMPLV